MAIHRAAFALAAFMIIAAPAHAEPENPIIAEAQAADAAYVAAQSAGELEKMGAFMADDYAYIDVGGARVDKAKVLTRREGDKLSLTESIDSENEAILLSPVTVLLRGKSEGTGYYFGGIPRSNPTRWSAIWRKDNDGKWRVVAEQVTVIERPAKHPPIIALPASEIAAHAGSWRLATKTPLDMMLKAEGGVLKASVANQFTDMVFSPYAPGKYFNDARPWELRFAADGKTLTLVSWGEETVGTRVVAP